MCLLFEMLMTSNLSVQPCSSAFTAAEVSEHRANQAAIQYMTIHVPKTAAEGRVGGAGMGTQHSHTAVTSDTGDSWLLKGSAAKENVLLWWD